MKEQKGNTNSQETLDSIELQTPSEIGAEEQEETPGEGNYCQGSRMGLQLPSIGSVVCRKIK